jgi:hypothetical protein
MRSPTSLHESRVYSPMRRIRSGCCARAASGHAAAAPPSSVMNSRRVLMCGWPPLARDHLACSTEVACSQVGCASAAANSAEKSNLPGRDRALASGAHHPATGHPGLAVKVVFSQSRLHACGYALANAGHDTRALQAWLGHKNIQHTVRYNVPMAVAALACRRGETRHRPVRRCVRIVIAKGYSRRAGLNFSNCSPHVSEA